MGIFPNKTLDDPTLPTLNQHNHLKNIAEKSDRFPTEKDQILRQ